MNYARRLNISAQSVSWTGTETLEKVFFEVAQERTSGAWGRNVAWCAGFNRLYVHRIGQLWIHFGGATV